MRELGMLGSIAALAAVNIGPGPAEPPLLSLRPCGPGVRSHGAWKTRFDPNINRHTGKPHEHRREIARRARQSA